MTDKTKEELKPFTLKPMTDRGYEGWHLLQYKDGGMAAPLCPEESEDMRKLIEAAPSPVEADKLVEALKEILGMEVKRPDDPAGNAGDMQKIAEAALASYRSQVGK